jgi:hypothetical protein
MNTKTKIVGHVLGLASLLMASQVNANTIQVNPGSITVPNGSSFDLTVAGAGFTDFTSGGSFILDWDPTYLTLTTSELELVGDGSFDPVSGTFDFGTIGLNGFDIGNVTVYDLVSGLIEINVSTGFGPAKTGDFDIAALSFLAISPITTDAVITVGGLLWNDAITGNPLVNQPNFVGASVTIEAVPVPAAVWLFGSGLIGLVGVARRKQQLA